MALSNLEDTLDQDLKTAMLSGRTQVVSTLRGIKSAILYAKVAAGDRQHVLSNDVLVAILQKEAKKRQESADMYLKGGSSEKAEAELAEKSLIEQYLPKQLSDAELAGIVDGVINELAASGMASMGPVISKVKESASGRADGASIARIVRERLVR